MLVSDVQPDENSMQSSSFACTQTEFGLLPHLGGMPGTTTYMRSLTILHGGLLCLLQLTGLQKHQLTFSIA